MRKLLIIAIGVAGLTLSVGGLSGATPSACVCGEASSGARPSDGSADGTCRYVVISTENGTRSVCRASGTFDIDPATLRGLTRLASELSDLDTLLR